MENTTIKPIDQAGSAGEDSGKLDEARKGALAAEKEEDPLPCSTEKDATRGCWTTGASDKEDETSSLSSAADCEREKKKGKKKNRKQA